eukprot:jgi/Psemu1/13521/gm1.13521_g
MYRWLKSGRKLLLFALQEHPAAKICLPNEEETQQYVNEISAKYPVLAPHRVWGACDGLKLHLQQSGNWMKQNQYYNGWTCGTYVNSILIFATDGRIRACILNAPDSFKLSKKPYLMWSSQSNPFNAAALTVNCAATSIQGGFPQMKDSMFLEETGDRKIILKLIISFLYNFQTARVEINTILNTYMSETKGYFSHELVPTETQQANMPRQLSMDPKNSQAWERARKCRARAQSAAALADMDSQAAARTPREEVRAVQQMNKDLAAICHARAVMQRGEAAAAAATAAKDDSNNNDVVQR